MLSSVEQGFKSQRPVRAACLDSEMERVERGRKQRLQTSVLAEVRQQIVSGVYGPGQRIPDRQTLGHQFGTSSFTVHKALTELEVQGFIEARGRRQGTFVKLDPPHLTHY